jgi:sporulation protein YlmC with PRC-barrel domain
MKTKLRMTLIAGAIAGLVSAPAWAATHSDAPRAETPQTEAGQEMDRAPSELYTPPSQGITTGADTSPGMGTAPGAASEVRDQTPRAGTEPGYTTPHAGVGAADTTTTPRAETDRLGTTPRAETDRDRTMAEVPTDNLLYTRTPEELRDTEVFNRDGDKIGKVKSVVSDRDGDKVHAVIAAEETMGREGDLLVSIEDLHFDLDGTLFVNKSKDDLQAREDFSADDYAELDSDRPIGEFAAFETQPGERPGMTRDATPGTSMPGTAPRSPEADTPRASPAMPDAQRSEPGTSDPRR